MSDAPDFKTCTSLAAAAAYAATEAGAATGNLGLSAFGTGNAVDLGVQIGKLYFEKCAAGEAASLPRLPLVNGKDYNLKPDGQKR